jgi:hypothetical protein
VHSAQGTHARRSERISSRGVLSKSHKSSFATRFIDIQSEQAMRKTLIVLSALGALALPAAASAQDAAAGAATGAAAGAVTGAVVGGPVGAAVGAGVGGTVGAAAADSNRPRVYVAPESSVRERTCVDRADGTRLCEEIRR